MSKLVCEQVSSSYCGLPCTHSRALIKANLTTLLVNFSFNLSPKSLQPTEGGDFWFVTPLRLSPPGHCHRSPPFDECQFLSESPPCHGGLNANVWKISESKRATFQPLFEQLSNKGLEGKKQDDLLGRHSPAWKFERERKKKKGANLAKFVWNLEAGC